jgi:hypothetical protein
MEDLTADHIHAMSVALVLERLLLDVLARFEQRKIEVRVLRGPASAHLDYPRAEQRAFRDIDILVQPRDVDPASETLRQLGLTEVGAANTSGRAGQMRRGATFRTVDGAQIDLHWMLVPAPFRSRVRSEDAFVAAETFRLGSGMVSTLPRELRLLNAAQCGVRLDPSIAHATLRDIAQIALHPGLDATHVRDVAARWCCRAALAEAVKMTWRELRLADVTALSAWAESYRPTEPDLRDLELCRQGARGATLSGSARPRRPRMTRPRFFTREQA